jgi:hypothetical protein
MKPKPRPPSVAPLMPVSYLPAVLALKQAGILSAKPEEFAAVAELIRQAMEKAKP